MDSRLLFYNIILNYLKIKLKNYIHNTNIVPMYSNILISPLALDGKMSPISEHSIEDLSKHALNLSLQPQLGVILSPRKLLAMSGDVFIYHGLCSGLILAFSV